MLKKSYVIPLILAAAISGLVFVAAVPSAQARDFIIRNATTSAVYFKVDGTLGYVGIATSTPGYTLTAVGTGYFSQPVFVGTPTASGHAATKSYVDTVAAGGTLWTGSGSNVYLTSSTQNVGIGTTNPTDSIGISGLVVDITGSANESLKFHGNGGGELSIAKASNGNYIDSAGSATAANNDIIFRTGRTTSNYSLTEAMRIQASSGNVGIGTTGPNEKLHVSGAIEVSGVTSGYGNTNNVGEIDNQSNGLRLLAFGSGTTNGVISFYTAGGNNSGGSEKMRIDTNGNVGIGTTGPGSNLEVNAGSGTLTKDILTVKGGGSSGAYGFVVKANNNSELFRVDTLSYNVTMGNGGAGNVGIATTTPSYGLTVVGTAQFSQPVFVGTPTAAGHAATKSYVDSMFTGSGQWTTSGSYVYLSSTTQSVGIGTASPGDKLEINTGAANTGVTIGGNNSNMTIRGNDGVAGRINSQSWGLSLQTAGSDRVYITNGGFVGIGGYTSGTGALAINGNVGIATTTPGYTLTTVGTAYFSQPVFVGTPTAAGHAATKNYVDSAIAGGSGSTVGYWTASSTAIYNSNSGNVGIGTTNPQGLLHLNGASPSLILQANNNGGGNLDFWAYNRGYITSRIVGNEGGAVGRGVLAFFNRNDAGTLTENMRIDGQSGNVGIATTTPQYTLSTVGTAYFSQPVFVGTPTASGHAATKSYVDTVAAGGTLWTGSGSNVYLTSSTQNVGIGTTGPTATLDVSTIYSAGVNGLLPATTGTAQNGTLRLWNNGGNSVLDFGTVAAGGTQWIQATNKTNLSTNYSLLLNPNGGDVGIGITSPIAPLHVQSTQASGEIARFRNNGGAGTVTDVSIVNNAQTWGFRVDGGTSDNFVIRDFQNSKDVMSFVKSSGNVGVATSTPQYQFTTVGTSYFSQPVFVGTPTASGHAATKSYVDSAVGASGGGSTNASFATLTVSGTSTFNGNISFGGQAVTALNMNSNNVSGVNKLTVTTIDPLYNIGGANYATYGADTIGLKVEAYGKAKLTEETNKSNRTDRTNRFDRTDKTDRTDWPDKTDRSNWTYAIDFAKAERGSDLWLFWQTVSEGKDMRDVEVLLTPQFDGRVWYELRPAQKQIVIYGIMNKESGIREMESGVPNSSFIIPDSRPEVSYHLVAPRHDSAQWPNLSAGSETGVPLPLR